MGKVAKHVIFQGSKCDVASFRVADVALCDMWTRDGSATVVAESGCAYGKSCKRYHVCCVFSANLIGRAARSGDKVQIA